MPVSEAYSSFLTIGKERFQEMVDDKPLDVVVEPEHRATTIRLPVYELEGLDTVATALGFSRQAFLGMVINAALGDVIAGFAAGFGENFTDYHEEQFCLDWVSKLDHPSAASRAYLFAAVERSLGLENLNA